MFVSLIIMYHVVFFFVSCRSRALISESREEKRKQIVDRAVHGHALNSAFGVFVYCDGSTFSASSEVELSYGVLHCKRFGHYVTL